MTSNLSIGLLPLLFGALISCRSGAPVSDLDAASDRGFPPVSDEGGRAIATADIEGIENVEIEGQAQVVDLGDTWSKVELDVSGLPAGTYSVQIMNEQRCAPLRRTLPLYDVPYRDTIGEIRSGQTMSPGHVNAGSITQARGMEPVLRRDERRMLGSFHVGEPGVARVELFVPSRWIQAWGIGPLGNKALVLREITRRASKNRVYASDPLACAPLAVKGGREERPARAEGPG